MVRIVASLIVVAGFGGTALIAAIELHAPWTAFESLAAGTSVLALVNVLCAMRSR